MMFVIFQAVFAWAAPFMDGIETFFGWLGEMVGEHISSPLLNSLSGVTGLSRCRWCGCILAADFNFILLYFGFQEESGLFTTCRILVR